jgi:hypothetical protein
MDLEDAALLFCMGCSFPVEPVILPDHCNFPNVLVSFVGCQFGWKLEQDNNYCLAKAIIYSFPPAPQGSMADQQQQHWMDTGQRRRMLVDLPPAADGRRPHQPN